MTEESAIKFPCHFPIKIIGHHKETFKQEIVQIIDQCAAESKTADYPIQITEKPSKENRYLALTITVYVENQTALDKIYRAINQHPDIKMVL